MKCDYMFFCFDAPNKVVEGEKMINILLATFYFSLKRKVTKVQG